MRLLPSILYLNLFGCYFLANENREKKVAQKLKQQKQSSNQRDENEKENLRQERAAIIIQSRKCT